MASNRDRVQQEIHLEKKHLSYFSILLEVDLWRIKRSIYKWYFQCIIIGSFTDWMTESQRKEVIEASAEDNNISVEKATELFDGIRDLRVQDVTDKTTSFEDKINIENQIT